MRNTKVSRSGKLLLSAMTLTVLIASILMVSAFAAPAVGDATTATAVQGDVATVYVTGAVAEEQVTTLVYLNDPTDANIIFIDQKAADSEGAATFSFKVPAAAADGTYTVLAGSESSDIAGTGSIVVGATDDVIGYSIYVYEGNFDGVIVDADYMPVTDPHVYFALTLDENNGEVAVFVGEDEIKYSEERQKYVGLVPATSFDAETGLPIDLSVTEQAPATFIYGDCYYDEAVDTTDSYVIDYFCESAESMIDNPVAADVYVDSYVDTTDSYVIDYYCETEEWMEIDDWEFDEGAVHYPAE